MNPDNIQHALVHAGDLVDSATRLLGMAEHLTSGTLCDRAQATAVRLLDKVDALLEKDRST